MNADRLPASPVAGLRTREMGVGDAPVLQRLLEANVDYFRIVHRAPAEPGEALAWMRDDPPATMPHDRRWCVGYVDEAGELGAYADLVAGLLAPPVCHLGLFMVAPGRHGRGDAQAIAEGLEDWARAAGAAWIRLGVVTGNTRGERFWTRLGFAQTRTRIDPRGNVVRVLFKPLAGGTMADYLALVERDRPETA